MVEDGGDAGVAEEAVVMAVAPAEEELIVIPDSHFSEIVPQEKGSKSRQPMLRSTMADPYIGKSITKP